MQLVVLLGPPSARSGRVIVRQELLVVAAGQDTHDLHRVVRIVILHRLRAHVTHHLP